MRIIEDFKRQGQTCHHAQDVATCLGAEAAKLPPSLRIICGLLLLLLLRRLESCRNMTTSATPHTVPDLATG